MFRIDFPHSARVAIATLLLCFTAGELSAGTFDGENRSELREIERRVEAAHFLSRVTFGPKLEEIDALAERIRRLGTRYAFTEWIDNQFELPASSHEQLAMEMIAADGFDPLTRKIAKNRYKHHAWWHHAITAPDQLRQRMAWALAQIFVVGEDSSELRKQKLDLSGQPQFLGIAHYYDTLVNNAFGNYRDLLEEVTYHPVMGDYLSYLKNAKENSVRYPDENYAREIQQLLSIGLYRIGLDGDLEVDDEGNLIETYDIDMVETFARVFTGLTYDDPEKGFFGTRVNFRARMVMDDKKHDRKKKVLHDGMVLPARQPGQQDISDALDNLAAHSNTAPFISRLLIQRLVKSNPSKNYLRRVAIEFQRSGGDFRAVLKEILLDPEAMGSQSYHQLISPYRLAVTSESPLTEQTRLREPVLRYAAMMRAYGVSNNVNGYFNLPALGEYLNQQPYQSPSVFNFYLPDHIPAGEIRSYAPSSQVPNRTVYAPEFQIFTPYAANRIKNRFHSAVDDANERLTILKTSVGFLESDIDLDFSYEMTLAKRPHRLLSHLDLLLCHGSMRDSTKAIIEAAITEESTRRTDRTRSAILAVLTSPDCAIGE